MNKPSSPFQLSLKLISIAAVLVLIVWLASCSSGSNDSNATNSSEPSATASSSGSEADEQMKEGKGIGPVKNVELGAIDDSKAQIGKDLFEAKCTSCHNYSDVKKVGPGLLGVTTRQKPEWIENQILNPAEMEQKDPTGKELLATYLTQMTNQNVTEAQGRNILEYFRQQDALNKK